MQHAKVSETYNINDTMKVNRHTHHTQTHTHTQTSVYTVITITGHEGVVAWLLSQKQCTGSEKDFTGSTPVHDAADEGRVRYAPLPYMDS